MREILFKAKRVEDGKWIQGFYEKRHCALDNIKHLIFWSTSATVWEYAQIDPETICQFTGLMDKNGNKIWENDIVRFKDTGEDGYEYREGFDFVNMAKVVYNNSRWELDEYMSENSYVFENQDSHGEFCDLWEYTEVIGNIFDNPELLEGGLI